MWKVYYNKLLKEALKNPVEYTFADVPEKYKKAVKKQADADLAAGILPQWQYNKMFDILEPTVNEDETE